MDRAKGLSNSDAPVSASFPDTWAGDRPRPCGSGFGQEPAPDLMCPQILPVSNRLPIGIASRTSQLTAEGGAEWQRSRGPSTALELTTPAPRSASLLLEEAPLALVPSTVTPTFAVLTPAVTAHRGTKSLALVEWGGLLAHGRRYDAPTVLPIVRPPGPALPFNVSGPLGSGVQAPDGKGDSKQASPANVGAEQPTSQIDWSESLGEWPSIAVAPDGGSPMVWTRFIINDLADPETGIRDLAEVRFARWDGIDWRREIVDELLLRETRPDIAVDTDGGVGVAYTRSASGLAADQRNGIAFRRRRPAGGWDPIEIIDGQPMLPAGVSPPVAIAYGEDGRVRVAHWHGVAPEVKVRIRNPNGQWRQIGRVAGGGANGAWLDMVMRRNDWFVVTLDGDMAGNAVWYQDSAGNRERVLAPRAGATWERPALCLNGASVAVVAFGRGPNSLVVAERFGRNNWLSSLAGNGLPLANINGPLTPRIQGNGARRYFVGVALANQVFLSEGTADPAPLLQRRFLAFPPARLIDQDCGQGMAAGGLHRDRPSGKGMDMVLGPGAELHFVYHYIRQPIPNAPRIGFGQKYVGLRIPSPADAVAATQASHDGVAGALRADYEPWQCYFDKDPNLPILRVRRWDAGLRDWVDDSPPMNAGTPAADGQRGCSIDVVADRVGVTWHDIQRQAILFAERNGGWNNPVQVVFPAPRAQHEFHWSSTGDGFLVYLFPVNGRWQLHLQQLTAGVWGLPQTDAALSPASDLSFTVQGGLVRIVFVSGVSVKYVTWAPRVRLPWGVAGGFSAPVQLQNNVFSATPTIARRVLGDGTAIEVAAWRDAGARSLVIRQRVGAGAWRVVPGFPLNRDNLTPMVSIDAFGKPIVAFRDPANNNLPLGFIRWNRFAGPLPPVADDDPPGGWETCAADQGGFMPALDLDGHDNLRISHRGECPPAGTICKQRPVRFTARP